jgi:glycosyltransferase involved in cell wall biosynthesis
MHVGFDITPLAGQRTGVGNYCYYLLKHLLQLPDSLGSAECRVTGFSASLTPPRLDGFESLRYRRLKIPTRALYKSWEWFRFPRIELLMPGIDVYHATNYFLPPARSARRVVTFHDLAFIRRPELCSPKISGMFARNAARFAAEADAVIACSESTRTDTIELLGADPAKVVVAYEAVDEDFAPIERAEAAAKLERTYGIRQPFLLFVGTIEPRKNLCALVQAFARIAGDIPHTLVLAGGPGWNSQPVFEAIEQLGLRDRVLCTGFVSNHSDLACFYSAADLFVFPSLYEGFGLPLLEAMTCGCPIGASNTSSVPEVAGEAALYFDPASPDDIAATIMRLIEDAPLRNSLVARGLAQAEKFSWDNCARATMDVYKRVIG